MNPSTIFYHKSKPSKKMYTLGVGGRGIIGLRYTIQQELKALLDPEFSNITTFLELFG